ncbi:unnamed protein product [Musa acuminata subsp. burmannicoides]
MQDTSVLGMESHNLHLHGDNFIIEQGFDNYDPMNDPLPSLTWWIWWRGTPSTFRPVVGWPTDSWPTIQVCLD